MVVHNKQKLVPNTPYSDVRTVHNVDLYFVKNCDLDIYRHY